MASPQAMARRAGSRRVPSGRAGLPQRRDPCAPAQGYEKAKACGEISGTAALGTARLYAPTASTASAQRKEAGNRRSRACGNRPTFFTTPRAPLQRADASRERRGTFFTTRRTSIDRRDASIHRRETFFTRRCTSCHQRRASRTLQRFPFRTQRHRVPVNVRPSVAKRHFSPVNIHPDAITIRRFGIAILRATPDVPLFAATNPAATADNHRFAANVHRFATNVHRFARNVRR